MASMGNPSYFRRASLFLMSVITLSMGLFTWTVFWPASVPYGHLGPLGSLAQYLVKNHYSLMYYGFWCSWAVHILEALYSAWLCRAKGITDSRARNLWVLQTFLFGIASLSHLLSYEPRSTKKKE
ncbi:hypothetical protein GDO86_013086 [Hymenochirus boettgeri]|uniref:Transmembrane protein 254 n=1 Tax=Hymenochirus boettgeri TaxID=247094 RepID=A0A8T2ITF3_9PIPI|nr:hypothetical protein GDO86_013086 [Hymenochirus boettgeri]